MTGRVDYAAVNAACRKIGDSLLAEFGGDKTTEDFIELVSEAKQMNYPDAAVYLVQRYGINGATVSQPDIQPLYGTDTLTRPGKVLIVRDEECQVVARRMLPRSPVLYFRGDPGAITWNALKGRDVIAWLDGTGAAGLVPHLANLAGSLSLVSYPDAIPTNWNIAQAEKENWDVATIVHFIQANALGVAEYLEREAALFAADVPALPEPVDAPSEHAEPDVPAEPIPPAAFLVPELSVKEMCDRFVFIPKGQLVGDNEAPQDILGYSDFEAKYAAYSDFQGRNPVKRAKLWRENGDRTTADKVAFVPGKPRRTKIEGAYCFNIWQEPRWPKPKDCGEALPFLNHVEYLIPSIVERNMLLDYVAHAVQCPQVRPHRHLLLFANKEGIGRSWMFDVLRAMYAPHSGNIVFERLFGADFNAELSGKIMMFCHEAKALGGDRFTQRNQMKTLFTAQRITINQKHLSTWEEDFYCRFLMATNSIDALPLSETDRRVEVLGCSHDNRGPDYWNPLHARLNTGDYPDFLPALWWYFKTRSIAGFNPGERATLSDTKLAMIDEGRSEEQSLMMDVLRASPYFAVASVSLLRLVAPRDEGESRYSFMTRTTALAACARDAGYVRYPKRLRTGGVQGKIWILDQSNAHSVADVYSEASRAHQDFELHNWDPAVVLDAWEQKKRRAEGQPAERAPSTSE